MSLTASTGDQSVTTSLGVWAVLPTFFSFVSDEGDFIGSGRPRRFTPSTGRFSAICIRDEVEVRIDERREFWRASFGAPRGALLKVGTYEGATRTAFRNASNPGIDVSGDGRGCNSMTGRFVVHEAEYTPAGQVRRFRATFEQRCESAAAGLRGEVRVTDMPLSVQFNTCAIP